MLEELRHSSIASSMTLWSMTCQTSCNKRFFSSSTLCSCDWCTRCWMSPHPISCNRPDYKVGAVRRPQIWRNESGCWLLKKYGVTCPVCRFAVLLKDEEIVWHVTHHGQQLLRQQHVAVIAAVDLHSRESTLMRSVRPSFEMPTNSVQVLSAARKVNQEDVDEDVTSMPGAAAPGRYPVNTHCVPKKRPPFYFSNNSVKN